jgi:phosphoenolpyruvate synthase/pyruvate phosphate dikinase
VDRSKALSRTSSERTRAPKDLILGAFHKTADNYCTLPKCVIPGALCRFPNLQDRGAIDEIRRRIGSEDAREFFIRRFSEGIARIAAAFYPKPVLVRTSDFKTNEYAHLIGGKEFEPSEENPMLG